MKGEKKREAKAEKAGASRIPRQPCGPLKRGLGAADARGACLVQASVAPNQGADGDEGSRPCSIFSPAANARSPRSPLSVTRDLR
jgi:hypothetical protein